MSAVPNWNPTFSSEPAHPLQLPHPLAPVFFPKFCSPLRWKCFVGCTLNLCWTVLFALLRTIAAISAVWGGPWEAARHFARAGEGASWPYQGQDLLYSKCVVVLGAYLRTWYTPHRRFSHTKCRHCCGTRHTAQTRTHGKRAESTPLDLCSLLSILLGIQETLSSI